jgi:hypothetical protein
MSDSVNVWWFCKDDHSLQYEDGRIASIGQTHTVDPEKVELCKYGLHGSTHVVNALNYGHGDRLFYCRLDGKVIHGIDKVVASQRTYLAGGIDVSYELRTFVKQYARDVVSFWRAPQVVVDYLNSDSEVLREEAYNATIASNEKAIPWSGTSCNTKYALTWILQCVAIRDHYFTREEFWGRCNQEIEAALIKKFGTA